MRGSVEDGSRYLSLALHTRAAMNNLTSVIHGEPVGTQLSDHLGRLLIGLEAQQGGNFLAHLQASATTSSFEELSILTSLYGEFSTANVAQTFSLVLRSQDGVERGEGAKRLISFLGAIESKALHYYTRTLQHQMV